MHHHHPMASNAVSSVPQQQQQQQQQRRRKKRPNYGTRIVEVKRGYNLDFGFTISGQQPCRLSCIVSNSPAEQAGLRPGDFLISVNGLNVSKLPHETVVQLIGNSFGSIRMQIAENYFSDSSDEENAAAALMQASPLRGGNSSMSGMRTRPRYLHHKTKMHRLRNSPQKKRQQPPPRINRSTAVVEPSAQQLRPLIEDLAMPSRVPAGIASSCSKVSANVANVSAIVRVVPSVALEYRAVVGYLGTIEMPKQISHSSKLQTVRSCIRKLRQEKRQPSTVLMTILPDCLRLQATNGSVLATYASSRLNYVSSSSESENRFFGLVTSAVHTSQADDDDEDEDEEDNLLAGGAVGNVEPAAAKATNVISISNSCHVFVVDTKLCDHQIHLARAMEFRIECTRDPISSLCLEFPRHAEYVVNLIRSMYTMRIIPPASRHIAAEDAAVRHQGGGSPQPSNHSEISTTTSNSDSGIGFNNDCTNISDRILVVDFPGVLDIRSRPPPHHNPSRPLGIFNNFDPTCDNRLTVRAMPDPKNISSPSRQTHFNPGRPDLLANFNLIKSPAFSLSGTRSCDDVLNLVERSPMQQENNDMYFTASHASMDDLALADSIDRQHEDDCFIPPSSSGASYKRFGNTETYSLLEDCRSGVRSLRETCNSMPHKLSPQVFITTKPQTESSSRHSHGLLIDEDNGEPKKLSAKSSNVISASTLFDFDMDTWSSLQNLHARVQNEYRSHVEHNLEATNSEPDLGVST